mmetsp:Transcript_49119/g.129867  ORF Transcript_49119/g.129867 Transcript_49119/m.129867 type:complete len:230 (+) Transcript_49119:542-1231(+)
MLLGKVVELHCHPQSPAYHERDAYRVPQCLNVHWLVPAVTQRHIFDVHPDGEHLGQQVCHGHGHQHLHADAFLGSVDLDELTESVPFEELRNVILIVFAQPTSKVCAVPVVVEQPSLPSNLPHALRGAGLRVPIIQPHRVLVLLRLGIESPIHPYLRISVPDLHLPACWFSSFLCLLRPDILLSVEDDVFAAVWGRGLAVLGQTVHNLRIDPVALLLAPHFDLVARLNR